MPDQAAMISNIQGAFNAAHGAGMSDAQWTAVTNYLNGVLGTKTFLGAQNLTYLGGYPVDFAVGQQSWGPIAIRKQPNGQKSMFITGANVYLGTDPTGSTAISEIQMGTPNLDWTKAARASLIKFYGAHPFYQGLRDSGGTGTGITDPTMPANYQPENVETLGLYIENEMVYVAYADTYNVTGWAGAPTIIVVKLNADGTVTAFGPYGTSRGSYRDQGYFVRIPAWFQALYGNNRWLGMGAAQTSGLSNCSMGPNLDSIDVPVPGVTPAYGKVGSTALIDYPNVLPDGQNGRCPRPGDYSTPGGTDNEGDLSPTQHNGQGYWNGGTSKQNAAVWVDLPSAHAVFFAGEEPTGMVWYGSWDGKDNNGNPYAILPNGTLAQDTCINFGTGPHSQGYRPRIWAVDPKDIINAAGDPVKMAAIVPTIIDPVAIAAQVGVVLPTHCDGRTSGMTMDTDTNILYLAMPLTDTTQPTHTEPVINCFQVHV